MANRKVKMQKKDPRYNHFSVSIVKSVFRFVASGLLVYAGYEFYWVHANTTDMPIGNGGAWMMAAGAGLFLAEILGIIEEIVE